MSISEGIWLIQICLKQLEPEIIESFCNKHQPKIINLSKKKVKEILMNLHQRNRRIIYSIWSLCNYRFPNEEHCFLIRLMRGNNTRCPIIINPSLSFLMLHCVKTPMSVALKSAKKSSQLMLS